MEEIMITSKIFLDLFILCLYWQRLEWTTVDKTARILFDLNIITQKQRSVLHKDPRVQSLFYQNISRYDGYYNAKKPLFLHLDHALDINRRLLLRNYRISLTRVGEEYARTIEEKYSHILTKATYFSEVERQEESKPEAMGAIMTNYKRKVKIETTEEQ